ncbi:MAG: hypothetical protein WCJ35_16420 [Planctomycetota bacterium]
MHRNPRSAKLSRRSPSVGEKNSPLRIRHRRLLCEPLEDRRMLSIYSANMDADPAWTFDAGIQWAWGTPTGGSGDYGGPDPTAGHTGAKVVGYNLSGGYLNNITPTKYATTPAINCSNYTGVTLDFWRWLGVEQSTYDHASIQVSNNGSTWTDVWQNSTTTLNETSWSHQTHDISSVANNQPVVYIRWGMGTTNGSNNYCGWNIDDVLVTGTAIDTTPPTVGGNGITCQASTTTLWANWAGVFADPESGISRYDWAIGTTPGGSDVQGLTNVGTSTSAMNSSLSLTAGTTYYVTTQATNGAGLQSTVTSNGIIAYTDTTAPAVTGLPNDGTGADITYQTSTTTISANWAGVFADPESGISRYDWAIGTTSGGTDAQGYTSVGTATSATNNGVFLTLGTKYYVSVRSTNGAGLQSTATSNGVTVDTTAPTVSRTPNDGAGTDITYQTSTATLSANWAGVFADEQSGITVYEWAIGTTSGGTDVQVYTIAGTMTSATTSGLSLTSGTMYYASVRATNGAGLQSAATSNGVTVDSTPPTISGVGISCQVSPTTLSADWAGVFADPESAIDHYEWALGTTFGGTDVRAFTNIWTSTSTTKSGLSLAPGTTYYVTVRSTNRAGLQSIATSNGVMIVPIYVDDTATGLNSGASWANAYASLQSALAAAVAGQVICVALGTYKPTTDTDRTVSFVLKNGVSIYGGYAGVGAPEPNARNVISYPSILSGDIGIVGFTADNSYHVVVGSNTNSTAVLDGFTITSGIADGSPQNDFGGGMYNSGGSPTLTNCMFTANSATHGGGLYNSSSSPTLTNCTFTANSASNEGGGLFNYYLSSPTLTNCTFTANSAK